MNTFREQIALENSAVFLNPEEFGELKTLEGKELIVIEDSDMQMDQDSNKGLYLVTKVLYVEKKKLPAPITQHSWIEYDGNEYEVLKVDEYMGITAITIEVNRA